MTLNYTHKGLSLHNYKDIVVIKCTLPIQNSKIHVQVVHQHITLYT